MFILMLLVIVHELGHLITASIFKYKIDKVEFHSFGGITKYNELLNTNIYKELIVLVMGPLTQILFYCFLFYLYELGYISNVTFDKIGKINALLLSFNLLPIVSLDGGKLLNIILEFFFSYKNAHILTIVISFFTILMAFIYKPKIYFILILLLLITRVIDEVKNHKHKINKFLLERYLYEFNYKEGRLLNNIYNIKRIRKHKIIKDGIVYTEKEYLTNMYKSIGFVDTN